MLKIIRFDYFPTCSSALFQEICHNIFFQVFVFKIFRFCDLHLMNSTNFSILPSINKHKLEETMKATDKPPPFVTLFRCYYELESN